MLRQPKAAISELLGVAGEGAGVRQRLRRVTALKDGREVEDRKRDHGVKLTGPWSAWPTDSSGRLFHPLFACS